MRWPFGHEREVVHIALVGKHVVVSYVKNDRNLIRAGPLVPVIGNVYIPTSGALEDDQPHAHLAIEELE